MKLKECMLIENECYLKYQKITNSKPTGIVVHSTGCNNPTLKRYVQPVKKQSYYEEVIADLGKNKYDNDWNRFRPDGRQVCVHGFIGLNVNNEIETYQTLPFDICCWGVGSGSKGSFNFNPQAHIQFEICEDNMKNEDYFYRSMREAQEFCAYLCEKYDLPVSTVVSHQESYKLGYGCDHSDCDHWLVKYGKNMDWFRGEVSKIIQPKTRTLYRVQVGAYFVKENAIKKRDELIKKGYTDAFIQPCEVEV